MKKTMLAVLLMLGLMFTQQAWAVVIDFGRVFATSGTISYGGGSTSLVGTGLSLDIVSDGSALNSYDLFGGMLDFSTGTFTGSSPSAWFFAPGGTITVTGGVDVNDNGIEDVGDIPSGTTLMSGSFIGTPTVIDFGGVFKLAGASFEDSKDEDLAALFGLDANGLGYGWSGFFNLSFLATGTPPGSFSSSTVYSGDIINEPKVPEPASTALMGLGLLGFVGRVIRRKARA